MHGKCTASSEARNAEARFETRILRISPHTVQGVLTSTQGSIDRHSFHIAQSCQ
jgi:hypothetical protein